MTDNNFKKGPHAAKNKVDVDLSNVVSSSDERKTVVLDEDLQGVEFEDKVWLYWTRNKNFIIFSITLAVVLIVGIQGYKMFKSHSEQMLSASYEQAVDNDQLLTFAKNNSGAILAGVAQLQVADAAYAKSDFAKAALLYKSAESELKGNILFGRACLGQASAVAMQDAVKGKPALKTVYDDAALAPAYRAQAGYMLGLLEKNSGNVEAAKTIFKAMSQNATFGMSARIAEMALNDMN